MGLKCTIKVKNNFKNINNIQTKISKTTSEAVQDVLKNIRGYAIRLERGHNSAGILVELVNTSTSEIKGRIYTDKNIMPYALFEHFGTGAYAEMNHIGKTEHFLKTGYTEWYIPKAKVNKPLNYPVVTINGVEFYIARGVKANHFMTDAEFKTREQNKKIFENKFKEMVKECCK